MRDHFIIRRFVLPCTVAIATVSACSGSAAAPQPSVRFTMDAPLCGLSLPVRLMIDAQDVGIDTLYANYGSGHLYSKSYPTTVGQHVIGARAGFGYVFPDRTVSLAAGQVFTDSLPFYCS